MWFQELLWGASRITGDGLESLLCVLVGRRGGCLSPLGAVTQTAFQEHCLVLVLPPDVGKGSSSLWHRLWWAGHCPHPLPALSQEAQIPK